MREHFDEAFVIDCSRCANMGVAYGCKTVDDAEAELTRQGWTYDEPQVYCPDCSGETA